MNNFYYLLLILRFTILVGLLNLSITTTCFGQPDTLRHYINLENTKGLISVQPASQLAYFVLPQLGDIVGVRLHLEGKGMGTCDLHIYGHEGGLSKPVFKKDLLPSTTINKSKEGEETVTVHFPTSVFVNNNNFFIELDNFTAPFNVKIDQSPSPDPCSHKDGGTFYPSYYNSKGNNFRLALEVLLQYHPITPIFQEVTDTVGIPLTHSNHSIAWGDINQDHWQDLLIGGYLYLNNKGHFEEMDLSLPIPIKRQVRGSVFLDMENDGDQDILMLAGNNSFLFINDGQGQFTKKTVRLPRMPKPISINVADINNDQYPDVFVGQLWSKYPDPLPNYLFQNTGALRFKDITKQLYLAGQTPKRTRGSQFTDYDLDGDMDLYVTNYYLEQDELLQNNYGRFRSLPPPFTKHPKNRQGNHGTGVDWYDYDNDGDFDLLLPQLAHPHLMKSYGIAPTTIFRNELIKFTDLKGKHGIEYEETHAGGAFGDVNNDGLVDVVMTVFYPCRYVSFYLQDSTHTFALNTFTAGLANITTGNDACFADFNNDGLLDVAMGEENQFRLFQNVGVPLNNWVKVKLEASTINKAGIGAKVVVHTKNNTYTQEVVSGRGQLMQKPLTLHFGLDQALTIEKIEVQWSKTNVEFFDNLGSNELYVLKEGSGRKK